MTLEKGHFAPGDRRLPASNLNAYNAAARAVDAGRHAYDDAAKNVVRRDGTDYVKNVGVGDLGIYELAEITVPELGSNLVGVEEYEDEYGDPPADGKGVYVITLEPIVAGQTGRAAFSGGPWELDVSGTDWSGADVGEAIGPDGIFVMSKAPDDGICEVVFAAGSGEPVYYAQAGEDMTADYDDTDETTIANTTYSATILNADGTASDTTMEVARQADVEIKSGQHGIIARSDDGVDVFVLQDVEERASDPDSADQWPGRMWAVDIT